MRYKLSLCVVVLYLVSICLCSSGDYLPEYRTCVQRCTENTNSIQLPFYLRLLQWNTKQECGYHCMHDITEKAIETGGVIHQFHGKWPFQRVFGIQELASVVFSILNGVMHLQYYNIMKAKLSSNYYLKPFYLGIAVVGMNAWLWSTVFHTRDTPLTEKLDYLSAGLYILYGLCVAVIRVFYVQGRMTVLWILFCLSLYAMHVAYLLRRDRFDYSYNMTACIIIGCIQNTLWLTWSIYQYTPWGNVERRPYAWMAGASVILVSCAMALEVFDFPPIMMLVDAHSLWHAATVPLIPFFYRFLIHDYLTEFKATQNTNIKRSS
ncbi:Per1-like protein [Pilobolus umbonatus]|nr:Per1-like protein [Pilobolus umbonatus]